MTSEDFCSMARATIRARGVLSAPAACLRHAAASLCVFMVACGGSAGAASPLGVAAAGSAINHHQRRNSVYGIFGGSVGNDSAASAPAHGGGAAPLAHYVLDLTSTPCTSSRCPTTRRSLGVCDLGFGHSSSFGCSALAHPGGAPGQATHANGGARHPAPVALAHPGGAPGQATHANGGAWHPASKLARHTCPTHGPSQLHLRALRRGRRRGEHRITRARPPLGARGARRDRSASRWSAPSSGARDVRWIACPP